MHKGTDFEVQRRIEKTLELYLLSLGAKQILQYFTEKEEITIGIDTINKYIKRAKTLIKKSSKYNSDFELGKVIRRYENLYQKAYLAKEYKTCVTIQKEISILLGLVVTKVEHSGNVGNTLIISDDFVPEIKDDENT